MDVLQGVILALILGVLSFDYAHCGKPTPNKNRPPGQSTTANQKEHRGNGRPPYKPHGQTLKEWKANRGLKKNEFKLVAKLISQAKKKDAIDAGLSPPTNKELGLSNIYAGVAWTLEGFRNFIRRRKQRKRGLTNFATYPSTKWSTTINYRIDSEFSVIGINMTQAALKLWESHTCLRFEETTADEFNGLYISGSDDGCWSYLGKVSNSFQIVNLGQGCTFNIGIPLHEIGHALGLEHEHNRPDRDTYINVLTENIDHSYIDQFIKMTPSDIDSLGLEYDLGSIMHYGSKDASINEKNAIETKDPKYQQTIGQLATLSWHDAYVINLAYCADVCKASQHPVPKCFNGGYQDPNNCAICRCPEGLGGDLCDKPKPSNGGCTPVASAELVATESPQFIQSRNYGSFNADYEIGDECSYIITAPEGCVIDVQFVGDEYGIANPIYHWVEIKTKADLSRRGYRYGGTDKPTSVFTSEASKMVIHFDGRDHYPYPRPNTRAGWKISYKIADPSCLPEPTDEPSPISCEFNTECITDDDSYYYVYYYYNEYNLNCDGRFQCLKKKCCPGPNGERTCIQEATCCDLIDC